MPQRAITVAVCLMLVLGATGHVRALDARQSAAPAPAAPKPATADTSKAEHTPAAAHRGLVDQYCVTCHNERLKTGGLALDGLDVSRVAEDADVWEKVVRKLRAGVMPPSGRPRPAPAASDGFTAWLESELDRAAATGPNPGRTEAFHRVNRAEYRNVIRDLLAIDIDVASLLPPDDASYGFDNMAGVLRINESLMERYLSAARKISRAAVGSPLAAPLAETFRVADELPQYDRQEGLPFGTRGGTLVRYNVPQDADYEITIEFGCSKIETTNCDSTGGFPDPHQLEIIVDGERVHLSTLEPRRRLTSPGGGGAIEESPKVRARVPMKAGPREIGVTFLKLPDVEEADGIRTRFEKPMFLQPWVPTSLAIYQPTINKVTIGGPFEPRGAGDTPSRRAIFACRPTSPAEETACARTVLSKLARRAYRRPASDADVQALLAFFKDGQSRKGFDGGIEMALRAVLVSPKFLFRVEADPARLTPGSNYRISDLDLASRLSFFLWSSIPDEALLDAAAQGRLKDPSVLEQQVRRMLADPRSEALTSNFAVQWLQLRKLDGVTPAEVLFQDFDEGLRRAFRRETELFFDSILREHRSVTDLLAADYTFVNERLARHYGIPNVKGGHFRRVTFGQDSARRGLLGEGSILTLTSHAVRTSPVFRGKWILENILGTPPPNPPANVPPLPDKAGAAARVLTMRERMGQHRANPVCSSCHSVIDPLGFALENFDPVGRWRTADETFKPVDASGSLPDGTRFENLDEFRRMLLRRPESFARTVTERLLTYSLGRGLEAYDMPTVRRIVRQAAGADYKLSSIILGIVKSTPFQMRRTAAPAAAPAAVAASLR